MTDKKLEGELIWNKLEPFLLDLQIVLEDDKDLVKNINEARRIDMVPGDDSYKNYLIYKKNEVEPLVKAINKNFNEYQKIKGIFKMSMNLRNDLVEIADGISDITMQKI
jgi:ribosomal 50S subunit-associated protein YjgA (DUF615 family)